MTDVGMMAVDLRITATGGDPMKPNVPTMAIYMPAKENDGMKTVTELQGRGDFANDEDGDPILWRICRRCLRPLEKRW